MLRQPKRLNFQSASHARSPVQEKQLATKLGGERVRGSGCGRVKGDVRVKGVLRVEAKVTRHNSFSVTKEMIEKIETAAITEGELPAMLIELNGGMQVAVVPAYVLEMLAGEQTGWRE